MDDKKDILDEVAPVSGVKALGSFLLILVVYFLIYYVLVELIF